VIHRPSQIGAFEFAVVAALRAKQLSRGCVPRIEAHHKVAVTAQLEVIAGKIARVAEGDPENSPNASPSTAPSSPQSPEPTMGLGVAPIEPVTVGVVGRTIARADES
jgi:DNA-directed RNA polymerase subunit K/omega